MAKDNINATVDYYYAGETVDNSSASGINSLINTLLPFFNGNGAPSVLKGSGSVITQQLNTSFPLNDLLKPQNATEPSTLPKAYLNILFFDEQMRFVKQNSKIVPISESGSKKTINEAYIEALKNGYVYVYVSNESNNLVYFDNFQVSHTRGPILEETHLYPFGSKMTAICSRALPGVENSLSCSLLVFLCFAVRLSPLQGVVPALVFAVCWCSCASPFAFARCSSPANLLA